jgi:hypothetical protein
MTLLYRLAEWHGLAKLRMHTDSTLILFQSVTTSLCREIRNFRTVTCEAFETVELEKEANARARRQATARAKTGPGLPAPPSVPIPEMPSLTTIQPSPSALPSASIPETPPSSSAQPGLSTPLKPHEERRKRKQLNISTYKFHALPDYVRTIRMFGTTDSYSTQTVCDYFIHPLLNI